MRDLLNNELNIGDRVIINQNTLTGSSTHRKILKKAVIEKFTPKQIVTNIGYISPNDVIKIFYEHDNPIPPLMLSIVDTARSKAIMELEKFRDYMEDVIDKAIHNSSCNEPFYDMLFDNLDERIQRLRGDGNV